jgi:ankyrin repeat protein
MNGNKEVYQLLADHGVRIKDEDINAKDLDGNACIHLAIKNGHKGLVHYLVTTFRDIIQLNEKNGEGLTPFLLAVNRGCRRILQMLIEQGTIANSTTASIVPCSDALHPYAHAHIKTTDVSQGGKEQILSAKNGQGKGFIHLASERDNLECLSYLLERVGKERVKHTLSERDDNNDTPFNLAAKNGNTSAMLLLLSKKKETDPTSVRGAHGFTQAKTNLMKLTPIAGDQSLSTTRARTDELPSTALWIARHNRRIKVCCKDPTHAALFIRSRVVTVIDSLHRQDTSSASGSCWRREPTSIPLTTRFRLHCISVPQLLTTIPGEEDKL